MQDLRLAVRALAATPIVAAVAIVSLALGIGASTAIFSLLDSLVLRTLPVAHPERLVTVSTSPTAAQSAYSYRTFDQIRERHLVDGVMAWSASRLTIDREPRAIFSLWVSGDYFATLGVPALLGRTLTPADDVSGGGADGPVAMISHRLWRQRFNGSPDVIGRSIMVERVPVTIVGVAPPDFSGVDVGYAFDLFLPVSINPLIRPSIPYDRDTPWLRMMLRLGPGQSLEAATSALHAAQADIRSASVPLGTSVDAFLTEPFVLEPASRGTSLLRHTYQRPLLTLLAIVGLVLLVAFGNLANLFLGRGAARRHELGVRRALGASRRQLIRQLLAESLTVSVAGGALGLLFSAWASHALVAQIAIADSPIALDRAMSWRVLAFTAVTAIGTAILFGLAPALRATRVAPMDALRLEGRGTAGSGGTHVFDVLLVAQVAVSLILVVAAGMLVRSAQRLADAPLGFDYEHVLALTVTAPTVSAADRNPFYHRLVAAAASTVGVAHAGGSLDAPFTMFSAGTPIAIAGAPSLPEAESASQPISITPGWVAAYGIPLRAGRDIDARDVIGAAPVMLVNEAFVRRFFPNQNIVGRTLVITATVPPNGTIALGPKTVVGVVGDAVYGSIREAVPPTFYTPLAQRNQPLALSVFFMAIRPVTGSAAQLSERVGAALRAIDPELRITFRPVSDQVSALLAQDRLVATLSTFAGTLALALAALGLYGVTAYAVSRRRTEIGIRMALGSAPAAIVGLILSRVLARVALGVIVGTAISLWASSYIAPLLYGLEPRDPVTLIGAAMVMGAAGVAAGWPPAWRASHIDPARVLRR